MADRPIDLESFGLELHERLGGGFAGEVWSATDVEAGRRSVAVKLITKLDADVLHALAREVDSVIRLRHPNIATLYRARTSEPPRFLVYELLEPAPGCLPLDERAMAEAGIKLCSGLAAAHRSGIIHCDIKPANILWRDGTEPLLSDFGSARIAATTRFRDGFALTPGWCPPWMIEGGPSVADPVSDVWSLAASLLAFHQGTNGSRPPASRGDQTELSSILHEAMPPTYPTEPTDADWALHLGRRLQELQQRRGWAMTRFPAEDQADSVPIGAPPRVSTESDGRSRRLVRWVRHQTVPIVIAELVVAAAGLGASYAAGFWPWPDTSAEPDDEVAAQVDDSVDAAAAESTESAGEVTGDEAPDAGEPPENEPPEREQTEREQTGTEEGSGAAEWRSRLVFASDRRGNLDLFLLDPDDRIRLLVDRDADDYSPSLSPDGSAIVFESNEGGTRAVYLAPTDGSSAPRRLSAAGSEATSPTWSPTGDEIAWATNAGGNWDLTIHDLNAGTDTLVTTATSDDRSPAWSPDGRSLVFRSDRTGNGDIYRLDLDDLGLTRLTDSALAEDNPAWGTGGLVAFEARVDGDIDVFTTPASPGERGRGDSTDGPTRRTTGLGFEGSPAFDGNQLVIVRRTATSTEVVLDPGGASIVIDESSGRTADLETHTG